MIDGTITPSRITRATNVYGVLSLTANGRTARTAPAPLAAAPAIMRAMVTPDRTPVATPIMPMRSIVPAIGAMPLPVRVATPASDARDEEGQAAIHMATVNALINRALDGTLPVPCPDAATVADILAGSTDTDVIYTFTRPDGVRVLVRWNGAAIERDYRYPVRPTIDERILSGEERRAVNAAIRTLVTHNLPLWFTGEMPKAKLTNAQKQAAYRARQREMKAAAKAAGAPTAPADGPVSRGENIVRPGTRHTGRHVPNAGR